MLDSGDWLHPVLNGRPHFTKPPLTYWVMALNMRLWGVNEFSARLHSALAALGVLILAAHLAGAWKGKIAACSTVAMLATSPLFFALARLADPNMLMTFWIVLAFWGWHEWQRKGRRLYLATFYVALGLGFFTKGPVSTVLVLAGVWSFRRWGPPFETSRSSWSWIGAATALAIGLWWFVWMAVRDQSLFHYFIGTELVARVASPKMRRNEPFWFPTVVLAAGFLPWTVLYFFRNVRQRLFRTASAAKPTAIWIGLGLILFTLSRSKLATYVLPLLPPLALMTAHQLESREPNRRIKVGLIAVVFGMALLAAHDWLYPVIAARKDRLTAVSVLQAARASYSGHTPIYFTEAPAGSYFYLRPDADLQWVPDEPPSDGISREERFAARINRLLCQSAAADRLLIMSAENFRRAKPFIDQSRIEERASNRKYAIVTVRPSAN